MIGRTSKLLSFLVAMRNDSMLSINKNLMPETNVPFQRVCTDCMMIGGYSALERTEEQFKELIEGVGLVVVKVWGVPSVASGPFQGR